MRYTLSILLLISILSPAALSTADMLVQIDTAIKAILGGHAGSRVCQPRQITGFTPAGYQVTVGTNFGTTNT